MPTFKGKDGKPRFSMNPQVGKSKYGDAIPGLDTDGLGALGGDLGGGTPPPSPGGDLGGGLGDIGGGTGESVEIAPGGDPSGQPPPDDTTQFHTISKDPTGQVTEIRNHSDFASATAHIQECMGQAPSGSEPDSDDTGGGYSPDLGGGGGGEEMSAAD
jgi:hypothetical protein